MSWYLIDPAFTEDKSTFVTPPPPLSMKPHKYPLSLPLIPTKFRCAFFKKKDSNDITYSVK